MTVMMAGDIPISYPDENAPPFFVAAYDAVPALCDAVDGLEAQLEAVGDRVDLERRAAELELKLEARDARIAELEGQVAVEVAARTVAVSQARRLARKLAEMLPKLKTK